MLNGCKKQLLALGSDLLYLQHCGGIRHVVEVQIHVAQALAESVSAKPEPWMAHADIVEIVCACVTA